MRQNEKHPLIHRTHEARDSMIEATHMQKQIICQSKLAIINHSINARLCRGQADTIIGSIPTNVNGLALGMIGLGILWQTAAEVLMFPPPLKLVADLISLLTLNIAGSLVLLYMCKAILTPAAAMRDLECVDSHATLCTLPMTLMSMSWVFHRHGAGEAALGIWAAGVGLHVVLLVLFVALHILPRIRDGVPWDAYQPAWMIPPIGICMASGSAHELRVPGPIDLFFYLALIFFFVLFPAIIYRWHFWPTPVAEEKGATYCIIAAPPALLLCQWVGMGGGASDALTHVLFGVEVVAIGLMMWQAPTLANLPLSRHTPAFTFPADVAARSVIVYTSLVLDTSVGMQVLCWLFLGISSGIVVHVMWRLGSATTRALYSGSSGRGDLAALLLDAHAQHLEHPLDAAP